MNKLTVNVRAQRTALLTFVAVCIALIAFGGTAQAAVPTAVTLTPLPEGIWDLRQQFVGHTNFVSSVAFSPDDKYILTGSWDGTVILWDVQSATQVRKFDTFLMVSGVGYSPDGKYILAGGYDNLVHLWNAQNGAPLTVFSGHTDAVLSVVFSPDGKYALSGSKDKTAILWDIQSRSKLKTFAGHSGGVYSVAFSPDEKYVLTGSDDEDAIIWDMQSSARVRTFHHATLVVSVAFSPDGKYVLIGTYDGIATLWDVQDSTSYVRTFRGPKIDGISVAFSPNGKYVLTGHGDGSIFLWNTQSGEQVRTFSGIVNAAVSSVAFSLDGKYILTGSYDKIARLWDSGIFTLHCPDGPSSRLTAGGTGYVLAGAPNRLRDEPGGKVIGSIPAGAGFSILQGPTCTNDGIAWWKVNYNGLVGWTAENEGNTYYLEP